MLYKLAGAAVLFLVMIGIKILGNSMFGRESLGDGDIKLMAVIALALGIFNSFIVLFFASVIALIFSLITIKKHKDGVIPFGPFLIIGSLILVYFGSIITPFVTEFFSL
jgi:prepilin signal peptidase PulO-like enzyme (type II secretory pathway)